MIVALLRSTLIVSVLTSGGLASEPLRLTHDGRLKFSPVFCDEGKAVVYVDLETPSLYRLKKLRVADQRTKSLHPQATTSEFEPAFSRHAPVYAYAHTRGALSVGINIHRAGETSSIEIPPGEGFAGLRSPAVSPDGSRIVFSEAAGGRQQLVSVAADGSGKMPLTDSRGIDNWPDFSPDGKRIVFGSSREGDFEIFIMQADGTDVRRLTTSPRQDIRPRFSPTGQQVAFTSYRDGNAEIYVMNADGSQPRRATFHEERDDYPAWHPSGDKLVVVSERDGMHDLYLLDLRSVLVRNTP